MTASRTTHQPQTWLMTTVVAQTGESPLQLQGRDEPERSLATRWGRADTKSHSDSNIPPSRLRESLLLAERVKRGAGRSIMELAWRVWA